MKPETVSAGSAAIFVAMVVLALGMAAIGVEPITPYLVAVGVGIFALFVACTQPTT